MHAYAAAGAGARAELRAELRADAARVPLVAILFPRVCLVHQDIYACHSSREEGPRRRPRQKRQRRDPRVSHDASLARCRGRAKVIDGRQEEARFPPTRPALTLKPIVSHR